MTGSMRWLPVLQRFRWQISVGALGALLLLLWPANLDDVRQWSWIWRLLAGFGLGFASAWIILWLRYAVEPLGISEVTIKLPFLGEQELKLQLADPLRATAWKLFVELSTRIATRSLYETPAGPDGARHGAGLLSAALKSLYDAFTACRAQLKEGQATVLHVHRPDLETLETYVLRILNDGLAPFLARWHPRFDQWKATGMPEQAWPLDDLCRRDLEATRLKVLGYTRGLGQIARVARLDQLLPPEGTTAENTKLVPAPDIHAREALLYLPLAPEVEKPYRAVYLELAARLPMAPDEAHPSEIAASVKALQQLADDVRVKAPELPRLPRRADDRQPLDLLVISLLVDTFGVFLAKWSSTASAWAPDAAAPTRETAEACLRDLKACISDAAGRLEAMRTALRARQIEQSDA